MTATIDLAPEEIEFLKEATRQSEANAALRAAADEYIRYRKRMNLIESDELIEFDESAVREIGEAEQAKSTD